jgi:hypothetical protein
MFRRSAQSIYELIDMLKKVQYGDDYFKPINSLSGATIGQHVRHIIELYQCLLLGYEQGVVNYDKRKRDHLLETNSYKAINALNKILENLEKENKDLQLEFEINNYPMNLSTNYFREIYYNLEHCIHHQALIKVALIELEINNVPEQFGVAPSTIQYRKQCAQ